MDVDIKTKLLWQWHPLLSLTLVFILWKAILILITLTSPGSGYDTSTSLLQLGEPTSQTGLGAHEAPVLSKFVRWDAIYYAQIAARGHIFEQEWAFDGFSSDLLRASRCKYPQGLYSTPSDRHPVLFQSDLPTLWQIAFAGVALSHAAHYGSMVLIWGIAARIHRQKRSEHSSIASLAALLHLFSPAGVFLSAPYSEGVFAFQSFLGVSLYITGIHLSEDERLVQAGCTVLAGTAFGYATVTRSNGILAGLLFAIDAAESLVKILGKGLSMTPLLRLASVVLGGLLVGWGMVAPQVEAYRVYCIGIPADQRRDWCGRLVPSIYAFVQSHYW